MIIVQKQNITVICPLLYIGKSCKLEYPETRQYVILRHWQSMVLPGVYAQQVSALCPAASTTHQCHTMPHGTGCNYTHHTPNSHAHSPATHTTHHIHTHSHLLHTPHTTFTRTVTCHTHHTPHSHAHSPATHTTHHIHTHSHLPHTPHTTFTRTVTCYTHHTPHSHAQSPATHTTHHIHTHTHLPHTPHTTFTRTVTCYTHHTPHSHAHSPATHTTHHIHTHTHLLHILLVGKRAKSLPHSCTRRSTGELRLCNKEQKGQPTNQFQYCLQATASNALLLPQGVAGWHEMGQHMRAGKNAPKITSF